MKLPVGILIGITVFILQAMALPHAGMTWDEPSSFFFGRANIRFWQTGDRSYLTDFKNPELFKNEPFQYIYGEDIYPPFSFLVSSATSLILSERLGLMSVIDAHHLGQVCIGVVGVIAMYGIATTIGFSSLVSALVTIVYATYPTIVAQMRNDAKDVPLMSMLVVFVYFLLKWMTAVRKHYTSRHLYGIAAAVSLGLAQGTKVSAAIMVPIIVLWIGISYVFSRAYRRDVGNLIHRGIEAIVLGLISLVSFIIIWPWLWDDPVGKLQAAWAFFKVVGFGMPTLYFGQVYQAGVNLPWEYPLGIFLAQTPPLLAGIFFIGIFVAVFRIVKKQDIFALFLLLWLLLGICRFFIPGVLIYAKVRHYIDAMPSVFLLAGYGAVFLGTVGKKIIQSLENRIQNRESREERNERLEVKRGIRWQSKLKDGKYVSAMVLLLVIVHQCFIILTHFPYEPSYFSIFGKGTKRAAEQHLFDVEYWASAVKEGMEAVSAVTDTPTTVYACTMAHLAVFYETENVQVKLSPWESQYIIIPNSYSWFGGPAEHAKQNHKLVYTVNRMGGPLLWVYKFDSPSFWNCGNETEMNIGF